MEEKKVSIAYPGSKGEKRFSGWSEGNFDQAQLYGSFIEPRPAV